MKMKKKLITGLIVLTLVSTVSAAQDPDNDGLYEDVNGDSIFNIQDVTKLFDLVSNDNTDNLQFDFNENAEIDIGDVQALYDEGGFQTGELANSQDIDSDGLHEDIDGNNRLTVEDVEIFFDNFENASVENYDFNQNGNITIADVQKLYIETASKTSPEAGNVTPEDNSVISIDYADLDGSEVTLSVDAKDPAGGDVNVTFYNGTDEVIGTNITGDSSFTFSWDVDEFREYSWYAVAEDSDGNTTETAVNSFEISNSDTTAPSITFDDRPSDTIIKRDIQVTGSTDENARIEYRLDGGEYRTAGSNGWKQNFEFSIEDLSSGDHTVTVRAEDKSGNLNTNSFDFTVAGASAVTFQVNVEKSYPESGIPIDPDSEYYPQDTDVDFNFTLEGNGNTYDISNNYQDGVCDFYGDEGWQLGGNYFCGTEVPENIELGTYQLVAEWELRGETHRKILRENFAIEDTARWYSSQMSHGGRVEGSVELNTKVEGNYENYNGQKVTCSGSTYEVNQIQSVTARCSNGITSTSTPPIVAFINRDGAKVATNNNNMFGDSNCQIGSGVTRQQIFGTAGLNTDNQGYRPENCNLRWQLGGDSSFTAHTFNQPGDYNVYVDYPNAISNSPDYICPARTDNNNLCDVGSISGDASGWNNVQTESVKVVNTEGTVQDTGFSTNVVDYTDNSGEIFVRRKDYTGDVTGTIVFKNTGSGIIQIDGLDYTCPSNVDCSTIDDLSGGLEVQPGETEEISWEASPQERTTGNIQVELSYDDIYGLDCSPSQTITWKYTLDEKDPETEEVN